uniref:RNase H type-1 domain-containing protein n=1 Tax=Panagrolaimus davidi TaxID=227884 RepID=A0A914Q2Q2_9BILA
MAHRYPLPKNVLNIFTNGAFSKETKKAGAGIYIYDPLSGEIDESKCKRSLKLFGCKYNNVAELEAIVYAFRELRYGNLKPPRTVIIWTDCQFIVDKMNGKTNLIGKVKEHNELSQKIQDFVTFFAKKDIQVKFEHVAAHNELANDKIITDGNAIVGFFVQLFMLFINE